MVAFRSCLSSGKFLPAFLAALLTSVMAVPASGGAIYTESFDFDTTNPTADYPAFSASLATGTAAVSSGVLVLDSGANNAQYFTRAGFAMPHTLSALVAASNSNGSYNVGLVVGQNQIVFHPGYGGAALRVEGPNGFGNTNVGFTPANGLMHKLEVSSDGTGIFDIKLTDGGNPANVFTTSFSNPGSVGGAIGLRRSGGPTGNGQFDDLTVSVNPATIAFQTFEQDFTLSGGGDAASAGGQLSITGQANLTGAGPAGAYTLTAQVGAQQSNGSYNVGLRIGENNIVFHPGFSGGALRVEGPGGFGNTNVGFTPANGVLHTMQVIADGSGNFGITLIDGSNPANSYTTSFNNPGSVGGVVGLRRSGPTSYTGIYDNLSVVPATGRPVDTTFDDSFSTLLAGGTAAVVDGVLQLTGPSGPNTDQVWDFGSFSDTPLIISAELGASTGSPGSFNVGLGIGQNVIAFHPGLSGAALRVEGPGGFGNQNVGFTPALDTLHLLQVLAHPNGLFEFTLTNRDDPTQVYSNSFFNPGSLGGDVFLRRSGAPNGAGLFDNVVVQLVPEPGSLEMLFFGAIGMLGLMIGRRRRKRQE